MTSENSTRVSKIPSILMKLASITSIRDIEVFELSILKTLLELLKLHKITLFKIGANGHRCHTLTYSEKKQLTEDSMKHSESKEVHSQEVETPDFILNARDWIASTGTPYTLKSENDRLLMIYPIQGVNRVVGYIVLELAHPLNETDDLVITSLLSISHNFHSLLEENQKDKLTGLLNRKTFEDSISKILNLLASLQDEEDEYQGEEKRKPDSTPQYWLAIMDIDHFKYVNDTYGHVFGDEVLLLMSQIMRNTFRSNDLIFRYGGEEFVVIVRATDKEDAQALLERFRQTVESFQFPQIGKVTISIGATKLDEHFIVPADLIGRADEALYYSKEHGRNQVNFYEDLMKSGHLQQKNIQEGSIELF